MSSCRINNFLLNNAWAFNCTAAIRDFGLDDLLAQLVADFSNIKSRLTEADREAMIKAASRSVTLEERVKKLILQSLARPPL